MSTLGWRAGRGLCTSRCLGAGLGSWAGQVTPHPARQLLLLGPSDVHVHAPRHAHLHTHTCRHAWSLDPEGTCPRVAGLPGSPGQTLAPACAQLPLPPLASCPVCTGKGFLPARAEMRWEPDRWGHCVLRGLSRLPLKKSKAKKKKKKGYIAKQPRAGLLGKRLFQKTEEAFLREKTALKIPAKCRAPPPFPVRDFCTLFS